MYGGERLDECGSDAEMYPNSNASKSSEELDAVRKAHAPMVGDLD